ncbi:ExsB family protein [Sphingobacteriaceae bacterium]|nr:ExsB family protein [Sphingobacteriaceae bacterium]
MLKCSNCILTSEDSDVFALDEKGICNYCNYYYSSVNKLGDAAQRKKWLDTKVNEIKLAGKGKAYDCILGVSGGVDSSYLAYWTKQQGLRPLMVHFDNGWNSELAVKNIESLCDRLGYELQTHVINWEEFKELQLAYLKAGVVDIEAITDHAIYSTILNIAQKYKIKYTINGFNFATEAIMPKGWAFDKMDWKNIVDIYSKYGSGKPLKTFPHVTFWKKLYYHWFLKLESIQVLNYLNYNKDQAVEVITKEVGWRNYGGKHHESIFTKFYQTYILPQKFKIDKRRAHLATLICSGQVTKEQALLELQKPPYNPEEILKEREYVLKKLGLSEEAFEKIMQEKPRSHFEFKTEKQMWSNYFKFLKILKPWKK